MFTTEVEGMPSLFNVRTFGSYRMLRSILVPSLLPLDGSTEVAGELQYTVEAQADGVRVSEFDGDLGLELGEEATVQRLCKELVVDPAGGRELGVRLTDWINQLIVGGSLNVAPLYTECSTPFSNPFPVAGRSS